MADTVFEETGGFRIHGGNDGAHFGRISFSVEPYNSVHEWLYPVVTGLVNEARQERHIHHV
jgi:hypothetical protein